MNKQTFLFLILFHFFSTAVFSQSPKGEVYAYGRKIVDTMASASMHGRGYVQGGDSIAALYLRSEFEKIGLKYLAAEPYQRFSFPINTFPGIVSAKLDDKVLVPGGDFIVYAHSSGSAGTYPVVVADDKLVEQKTKFKKFLKQNFRKKVLLINDTGKVTKELQDLLGNAVRAKAVVSLKDKLTLSMAQETSGYLLLEVLRTSYHGEKEMTFDVQNQLIPDHKTQNVIGCIRGSEYPDSFIVFSAHYDHLGHMGKDAYFPGANDNASGCAMLLNLARHYSKPENQPKYSIAFMAFAGEEVGLLGSKFYTENPLFSLKNIKFLLNMDIMGTGEEGITVVNGSVFKTQFEQLKKINADNKFIKDVKIRGKAANSDHYFFSEKGVPAFFIYTMGGIKAYHDIYDKPETLPLNEFENLFKLIVKFGDFLQMEN
ncbi:MAG: M20/M25/M40 family metallo-hydrolase [Bacteroidota bacterium]|nr:M20/M25/M40 family metallo-hydrolase [Bacteroidota bacterium]